LAIEGGGGGGGFADETKDGGGGGGGGADGSVGGGGGHAAEGTGSAGREIAAFVGGFDDDTMLDVDFFVFSGTAVTGLLFCICNGP